METKVPDVAYTRYTFTFEPRHGVGRTYEIPGRVGRWLPKFLYDERWERLTFFSKHGKPPRHYAIPSAVCHCLPKHVNVMREEVRLFRWSCTCGKCGKKFEFLANEYHMEHDVAIIKAREAQGQYGICGDCSGVASRKI